MTKNEERFSPFLKQCFVTTAVGLNLLGHGSVTGFPAILLPQLHQPDSSIKSNKTMDSWIASVFAITLFIGSISIPAVMDRFGRKIAHYIICATSLIAWLMTSLAGNVEVILVGRIIGGMSFGMMLPLRSVIIGEYTSPKYRGAFLATVSLTIGSGMFFAHLVGSFLSWRKTALVILFLPLTSLIMTFFIPESPSYLVYKGRYNDCKRAFRWLRGDTEEEELEAMIQARIEFKNASKNTKKFEVLNHIRRKEFYKPIILMLHMNVISQICGAPITATFATTIIALIMNPDVNAEVWMLILDTERTVVNILAIFVINKVKRRTMVFTTSALCVASLLGIAGYVYARNSGILPYDILWIPGTLMVLQFFAMAMGSMPMPSVLAGEVFPLQYRSIGGTISVISSSGSVFVLLKTFPSLVTNIGISGAYLVYGSFMTYCVIVIWLLLPETKGKTLQDIEDEYRGKVTNKDERELQTLRDDTEKK